MESEKRESSILINGIPIYQSVVRHSTIRTLWISEERELVHEIAGLGELREPWHSSQMSWLENHLNLINTYTTALENLDNCRGQNITNSLLSVCRSLNIGEAAGDQTITEQAGQGWAG